MKIMIYGINGKMGQVLARQILNEEDMELVAGIECQGSAAEKLCPCFKDPFEYEGEVDLIIDFSNPANLDTILAYARSRKLALVIATTGFSEDEKAQIEETAREIPILLSSNMSLGVNLLSKLLREISPVLSRNFDIEIIEKHHNQKVDSPSGTAYLLANSINESLNHSKEYVYGRQGNDTKRRKEEIGIHAIRGGTIAGEHSVIFAGVDEIIEIKHTALSKNLFALGAIEASRFLVGKGAGLYNMEDSL